MKASPDTFIVRRTKGVTNARLTKQGFIELMRQLLATARLKMPKGSSSKLFEIVCKTKMQQPCVTFDRFYAIVHEMKRALFKVPKTGIKHKAGRNLGDFQMRSSMEAHPALGGKQ